MKSIRTISSEKGELAHKTCVSFFMEIRKLFQTHEFVTIALSGGGSVRDFYSKIPEHASMLTEEEWKCIHFFWADERLVPKDSWESNYKLGMDFFLNKLLNDKLLTKDNIHRFKGEAQDPEKAAEEYSKELKALGGMKMSVLGSGPDGHTASLFPNHELLGSDENSFLIIKNSPKPPAERMTMSPNQIKDSEVTFIFFMGESKKEAYEKFADEKTDFVDCPSKISYEGEGICYVISDLS